MTAPSQVLKIRRPDDWHLHLRDGDMLKTVVPYTSEIYGRAIVMPNLAPPVTTVEAAVAYRQRILDAVPAGHDFTPLMTCYLTDSLDRMSWSADLTKACSPLQNFIRQTQPLTPATALRQLTQSCRYLSAWKKSVCHYWCMVK